MSLIRTGHNNLKRKRKLDISQLDILCEPVQYAATFGGTDQFQCSTFVTISNQIQGQFAWEAHTT